MKTKLLIASLGFAISAGATAADSQSWPTKPVRVIVPSAPGGGLDTTARIVAQQLSQQLGQPFVVENKPGAGTTIGNREIVRSPADGYTLLFNTPTFIISQQVYSDLPYERDDFLPLALVTTTPMVMITSPKSGFKTLDDYIQAAKANPEHISYSSSGSGSTPHLGFEMLQNSAGIELLHVPFKGGGEAITAVIAGTTDTYLATPIEVRDRVNAGQLVALGTTGTERAQSMPDVPTLYESGLTDYELVHFLAVLVNSDTPPEIVEKLSANIVQALQAPEVRDKLSQSGDVPAGTLEEATEMFERAYPMWTKVVELANIQPN
ncbi:MAG: Bug family tripartite tricarboxylate transporter substrate binding protein [Pigmentiphaga sp.]